MKNIVNQQKNSNLHVASFNNPTITHKLTQKYANIANSQVPGNDY